MSNGLHKRIETGWFLNPGRLSQKWIAGKGKAASSFPKK